MIKADIRPPAFKSMSYEEVLQTNKHFKKALEIYYADNSKQSPHSNSDSDLEHNDSDLEPNDSDLEKVDMTSTGHETGCTKEMKVSVPESMLTMGTVQRTSIDDSYVNSRRLPQTQPPPKDNDDKSTLVTKRTNKISSKLAKKGKKGKQGKKKTKAARRESDETFDHIDNDDDRIKDDTGANRSDQSKSSLIIKT